MLNERFCVSFWLDGNNHSISAHREQLFVNELTITLKDHINSVAIGKDMILLTTEKRDENGTLSKEQPKNNIFSYDFNGNFLWNIEDIMEKDYMDHPQTFYRVAYHTTDSLLEYVSPTIWNYDNFKRQVSSNPDHEYIVCHTICAVRYIFDITDGSIINHMQNC